MGSHEVAGMAKWLQFRLFQLHTFQNVATLMPSLTSHSCNNFLLSIYLARQVGAIYRLPEHPWMPHRPVNEALVKADR